MQDPTANPRTSRPRNCSGDPLQEDRGNDLIGVDIDRRNGTPAMVVSALTLSRSQFNSNRLGWTVCHETAGGRHCWGHQMCGPPAPCRPSRLRLTARSSPDAS